MIEPALDFLKAQRQVEIAGGVDGRAAHRTATASPMRAAQRAALFLEANQYVGVAPVPFAQYRRYMRNVLQDGAAQLPRASACGRRSRIWSSASTVLDQLGPAINCRPLDVRLRPARQRQDRHRPGDSQAARRRDRDPARDRSRRRHHPVFDPVNHEPIETPSDRGRQSRSGACGYDRRWVRCRRPMVMVGGELTLEALELSYNPSTGFYRAPVQAIANGGVLVIDDFGRQQCSPRDLLNRWIVPLESRVDFLTLQSGQKFEMPFMVLVVFATNIKPSELVDEAFLRRIHYKVFAESPTVAEFMQIFENCCSGPRA